MMKMTKEKEVILMESLNRIRSVFEEMGYTLNEMERIADLVAGMADFMKLNEPDRKIRDGAVYLCFMALESLKNMNAEKTSVEYIG